MAKKHMRRCSRSLIIREMEIKTAGRYWFTLVRMTIIKKSKKKKSLKITNPGRGVEKREPSYAVGRNVN